MMIARISRLPHEVVGRQDIKHLVFRNRLGQADLGTSWLAWRIRLLVDEFRDEAIQVRQAFLCARSAQKSGIATDKRDS